MPGQPGCDLDRRLRGPCGVRIQAQRMVRERGVQRLDRGHLLLGREHPTLEFDCGETVFGDHPLGLRDDARRVQRLAPGVRLAAGMGGPFVEQVGAERHRIADLAAEQIRHRPAGRVALDVQAGHLQRREDPVDDARRGDHARQAGSVAGAVTAETIGDRCANRVEREHIQTGDRVGRGFQPLQVHDVGVGLPQPDQTGIGVQLDDGPQRVGLVHPDGVEQRRVDEGDRGDAGAGDPDRSGHQCAASTASSLAMHGTAGLEDLSQSHRVFSGRHDQRRPHRPGVDTLHRHAGLDQRHRVTGHRVAQAHQGVEELPQQCVDHGVVVALEGVVERQREFGCEREGGRRVQRHADRPVRLLGHLGGGQPVEELERLAGRGPGRRSRRARSARPGRHRRCRP